MLKKMQLNEKGLLQKLLVAKQFNNARIKTFQVVALQTVN